MSEIRVKDNESLDSALRRFKRSCAKAGVLQEVRKREHYEKPSVKRKKKSEAAIWLHILGVIPVLGMNMCLWRFISSISLMKTFTMKR